MSTSTLADFRRAKGLTLEQLGERMGVSHVSVMKLENQGNPRLSTLKRYAVALEVPIAQIIEALEIPAEKCN
jgi:transcriptional regulator with XRE-family HTH domain